ncbi:hypothetical protein [Nonomuraea soli]|uniref:DUF320 domain-containing protein n=1 Tax=Nonomuraea soli TaxID=1032476 RepID=A0A7W0CCU8_9ACTN|nr:hypothetical protein [Nonomuraea soli]MBA2888801.1 hypothetical protein [Nonomuraea soli]
MIKKLCATGAVLAAATGVTLLAAPAHADSWTSNWSSNSDSSQSGNNFGNVAASNVGGGGSTNVNNINGIATTASDSSISVTYIFR